MTALSRNQQDLLDVLPDSCALVDGQGVVLSVNRCWKEFACQNDGDEKSFYLGQNYLSICKAAKGESAALASKVAAGLADVLASEDEFSCEYPCHSPTVRRWFEVFIRPIDLAGSRCAMVLHRNVTSRKEGQISLEKSEVVANELAALVASSSDAIISIGLDGNIYTWNAAAEAMYGYRRDEIVGKSMETLYPPDWPHPISYYVNEVVAGRLTRFEVVRRTKSGDLRDVAVSAAPIRNAGGEVIAISNIHRDITEQNKQFEQQKFITQELTHRTKNILAVVSAIERQTAQRADTVEEFHRSFSQRLSALSASNDLLVASDWTTVSMHDLVDRQLSAFSDVGSDDITVGGPAVLLAPAAVQSLGMSIHELATNAVKYGALAQSSGKLELTWQTDLRAGQQVMRVAWRETGLTIDGKPASTGFGHSVLTSLCERSLGANVEYTFAPDCVSWMIEIPGTLFSAHQH